MYVRWFVLNRPIKSGQKFVCKKLSQNFGTLLLPFTLILSPKE